MKSLQRHSEHTTAIVGIGTAVVGFAILLASTLSHNNQMLLGIGLLVTGNQIALYDRIMTVIRKQNAPSREVWDDGYEYGHKDGRRIARPVVIPMRRASDCTKAQSFYS